MQAVTDSKVAQLFDYVNPSPPDSMIHHNVTYNSTSLNRRHTSTRIILRKGMCVNHYGVSSSQRVLSPHLLLKRFDRIREVLQYHVGLTKAQWTVTMRLLRLWAYYGQVYPKESMLTSEPGCSKATFWRTIKVLEGLGLLNVVNRYRMHYHAQISNLYLLHNLVVVIARYLAEHGQDFKAKWIRPLLQMPGSLFWSSRLVWVNRIWYDNVDIDTET